MLREWLREKQDRGVRDVRVVTVLQKMDEEEAALAKNGKPSPAVARKVILNLGDYVNVTEWGDGKVDEFGDLIGTAEVAELLDVERSRIGKWIRRGHMPKPLAQLAAGPVWLRSDIEGLIPWVEEGRRKRGDDTNGD